MKIRLHQLIQLLALMGLYIFVYFVYLPGLSGGFLFDDFANLQDLSTFRGVVDLETARNFIFGGISGPLGRPISLATFLLDDNTWPTYAPLFKATNFKIHCLVGLVLCWATLLLMRLLKRPESEAVWIAIISSGIWLLHPYMLSTTLYIIQRMAQLAALFVLAGTTGYLYGRSLIEKNKQTGYIWMSVSLILGTFLAVFSKENGILLPLTVFMIECCLPESIPKLNLWWKRVFFGVPAVVVVGVLASKINLSQDAWPSRNFNQLERLLTEPRIIWEYLYHLYIPKIEVRGLFQDAFIVSRSLMVPFSTLPSIIGLCMLLFAAIRYRHRYMFGALAVLYFLMSHLIESTLFNLELYFEHRNYSASAFLFLPIAVILVDLRKTIDVRLLIFCILILFLTLGFLTWKRANLWSNSDQLELYWAASTPESPRARSRVGVMLYERGLGDESIAYLEKADNEFQTSGLLTINTITAKVLLHKATESDFIIAGNRLEKQSYDLQSLIGFRHLVEQVCSKGSDPSYAKLTFDMLNAVGRNPNYQKDPVFSRMYLFLLGKLYIALNEPLLALDSFKKAIPLYNSVGDSLAMAIEMSNADYPTEGLVLLDLVDDLYKRNPEIIGGRSKAIYDRQLKIARFAMERQKQRLQKQ